MVLWWSSCLPIICCFVGAVSFPLLSSESQEQSVTVSSYNLWNVMFNWDVRKYRIAEMIRETNPDIIGFQEVRADRSPSERNQLSDLQELLPYHRWKVYLPVQDVKSHNSKSVHGLGWEVEGLGLLSRHPILNHTRQDLAVSLSPDKNKRKVLHATIKIPSAHVGSVHVSVVHLSYDKKQQCNNIAEIAKYVDDGKFTNSIIMGDFNTYKDFEEPMQRLLNGKFSVNGGCEKSLHLRYPPQDNSALYNDAWKATHPHEDGHTFSNMPTPGLESRPDRIMVSRKTMTVQSASVTGDGTIYRDSFSSRISWNRFTSVLNAAYLSYHRTTGYACYHDCGPHGSCRCGVCVAGDNKHACLLPNCSECDADTYFYLRTIAIIFAICVAQWLYAALQVMFILNRKNQRLLESMGINCCLCYPGLYTESGNPHRSRWRFFRLLTKIWPCFRMPALFQMASTSVIMVTLVLTALYQYGDIRSVVRNALPEEYYPSDHLLLTAVVTVSNDGPIIQPI